ncbi:Tetratricopeptide-like helical domain superfamily [Sesbania bispinosa]|nr:Tetratricopeptide-like helical domain superfamily [Sesbania bispinosa]
MIRKRRATTTVPNIGTLKQIHALMIINGFTSNVSFLRELVFAAATSLVGPSATATVIEYAHQMFDQIPEPDTFMWNTMIRGSSQSPDPVRAVSLYALMHHRSVKPDNFTFPFVLKACTKLFWVKTDMYAKCGSIGEALHVFRLIRDKDVASWNSVISGLAFHGHADESLGLFREMQRTKVCPDEITFVSVLVACSHAGKVDEGYQYFDLMRRKYKIEANIRHYGCMVDMLGRAGLLKEAFDLIASMKKIEPNEIVWRTLLGACKVHGDVELAKRANEELLRMRTDQSGDYVLLSNTYASQGEWYGVEKVRKLMDDSGVTKNLGSSFVEA